MSLTEDDKQWISRQLDTKLEALETRLLRAFHDRASPAALRARSHAAVLRVLDIDIEPLGNSASKIEPAH
jgi:hypothetical protein